MENKAINIAIADDHTIVRKGFKDIINAFGNCSVILEADNGDELLKKIGANVPDICILDINMPVKNGYDTVIDLKKQYPDMKVLVLTMYNSEYAILKMLRGGANGYLLKNCHPNDLQIAINAICNKGYYHTESVTGRLFRAMEKEQNTMAKISDKETHFLELCCKDLNYKEMADIMHCSPRTVEGYRDSLFVKLKARSRTALAVCAIQTGMVSLF
jgi:two-component system invasion response regulator UvrY